MRQRETTRYLTKNVLRALLRDQDHWDYNRQLDPGRVEAAILGHADDTVYPLRLVMEHTRRDVERCEPHYRCELFLTDDGVPFVDLPVHYFDGLPKQPPRLAS